MRHQQQTAFENIVEKGETAPFPTMFSTESDNLSPFVHFLASYLYLLQNWKCLKLAYQVKG